MGATTCSSSGCHGGGGQNQNQYLVWSLRDFHSQRPFATLTTARSRQIAGALQIADPAADQRCTSCHAPLHAVPASLRGDAVKISEGVSCESCHGPAENWLRSHTRGDWTHADRVSVGMRDLKNLYVRANTCIACHQTVSVPLLKAGHPELIFELDGQSVSQPKHWREAADSSGAQAWLVGQLAALREMSWQLSREAELDEKLATRWAALLWLLQKVDPAAGDFSALEKIPATAASANFLAAWRVGDDLARRTIEAKWTDERSRQTLKALTSSSSDFQDPNVSATLQARRAERLVLALERLSLSCKHIEPGSAADTDLNRLFKLTQSIPDFDPPKFAEVLKAFTASIGE